MIARIQGRLEVLEADRCAVAMEGGLTLEVLLPAFAASRLNGRQGEPVELHTLLFLEAQAQGSTITPYLAGFLSVEDRAFYQLFTTTKGIGHRKALRALALPSGQIAGAIVDRDVKLLQSLPEVGKRTAETIVTQLREKAERFAGGGAVNASAGDGGVGEGVGASGAGGAGSVGGGGVAREALEVLTQLGENRAEAVGWIDRVMAGEDSPRTAEEVVGLVYRMRGGS